MLCKIDIHRSGASLVSDCAVVHLEHILPVNPPQWAAFDRKGVEGGSWIRRIGNLTLLEKSLNQPISNKPFKERIGKYRERKEANHEGTKFRRTYNLYDQFEAGLTDWNSDRIIDRSEEFAAEAATIWSL